MSDHRYLVSARKYRPSTFGEVVGQEHVTETLKNAIRLDRLAHAYLFSGPRGVGKTTGARILAKAINCVTPLEERKDASEPCQTCPSCVTFDEGRSMNVIEVDAASNNKVDDIRELRETVRIPPQGAKRKVYIIDEVHMLSASAFNALLKTLEEPPPYVLFIFATTEPHKVLPTILSRCQRFDFRRISIPEIVSRLELICRTEKIQADEASLMLIARKGDGALRDALSAFDQAVALCGTDIRYDELAKAFRVVDVDIYFDVTNCAQTSDSAGMLGLINRVVTEGYDLHEFLNGLLGHLRNIFVARTMADTKLIEATGDVQKLYAAAAKYYTEPNLLRMMSIVAETEESIRYSAQPRLTVELGALKLVQMASVEDLRALINLARSAPKGEGSGSAETPRADVADGAKRIEAQQKATPKMAASQKPVAPVPTKLDDGEPAESKQKLTVDRSGKPSEKPTATIKPKAPKETPVKATSRERSKTGPGGQSDKSVPLPQHADDAPLSVDRSQPPAADDSPGLFGPPALKKQPRSSSAKQPPRTEGSAALSTPTVASEKKSLELREIETIWLAYVRSVKSDRIHVGALLQHASPAGLVDGKLNISVPDDFHRRLLTNQEEFLRLQLAGHTELVIKQLFFAIRADQAFPDEEDESPEFDPQEYLERKRQESPMIRALFDEFGGELVW